MNKIDPTRMRTVEKLNHFRCRSCKKWWSVSDAPSDKEDWFCPWCGANHNYKVEK